MAKMFRSRASDRFLDCCRAGDNRFENLFLFKSFIAARPAASQSAIHGQRMRTFHNVVPESHLFQQSQFQSVQY